MPNSAVRCISIVRIWISSGLPSGPITVVWSAWYMYQALHTTVIGPEGRPLEIQIRTMEMHRTAEFGIAAHWIYKEDGSKPVEEKVEWLRHLLDWQQEMADPQEFAQTLKADLFEDEVFVFTPKGEVKSLGAGATPLDFAYSIHTDVGHRCVGAKVNGKIV